MLVMVSVVFSMQGEVVEPVGPGEQCAAGVYHMDRTGCCGIKKEEYERILWKNLQKP